MEFKLKNGKTVLIRPLEMGENVFTLSEFVNETREASKYLTENRKVTPEEEQKWVEDKLLQIGAGESFVFVALDGEKYVASSEVDREKGHKRHLAQFGIMIHPAYQGQGLGQALSKFVLKHALAKADFEQVFLHVFANNKPAVRVYEKLGFKTIATRPRFYKEDGEYSDDAYMTLDKALFLKQSSE